MVKQMLSDKVIKKYTNLRVGDTAQTMEAYPKEGEIVAFEEENGNLYLILDRPVPMINDRELFNVRHWKRKVLAYVGKQVHSGYWHITNFYMKDYEWYKAAADATNKFIKKPDTISISKTARDNQGRVLDERGAVWMKKDIEDNERDIFNDQCVYFQRKHIIKEIGKENNIIRATKQQIVALPAGEKYYMMYVHQIGYAVTCVECAKVFNGDEFLCWCEVKTSTFDVVTTSDSSLFNTDICRQFLDMINDDGSFEPSHSTIENEDGYLYIENRKQN